jgi:hypothetical protein
MFLIPPRRPQQRELAHDHTGSTLETGGCPSKNAPAGRTVSNLLATAIPIYQVLRAPPAGFEPATHGLGNESDWYRPASLSAVLPGQLRFSSRRVTSSTAESRGLDGQMDGQLLNPGQPIPRPVVGSRHRCSRRRTSDRRPPRLVRDVVRSCPALCWTSFSRTGLRSSWAERSLRRAAYF